MFLILDPVNMSWRALGHSFIIASKIRNVSISGYFVTKIL